MNFAIFKGEKSINDLVTRLYQVKSWGSTATIKSLAQGLIQANSQLANLATVAVGSLITVPDAAQPINQAELVAGAPPAANQPAQPAAPAPPAPVAPAPAAVSAPAAVPPPTPAVTPASVTANINAINLANSLASATGRAAQLNSIFDSLKTALPVSLSNAVTNAKNSVALVQAPEVQAAAAKDPVLAQRLTSIAQQANNTLQNAQAQQTQFLEALTQMQQDIGQLLKS
jgi:hypothetical protein